MPAPAPELGAMATEPPGLVPELALARRPCFWGVLCEHFTQRAFLVVFLSRKDHRDMHESQAPQPMAHTDSAPPIPRGHRERLLRIDDVCYLTGLGRSTIYTRIQQGAFPPAVQLLDTCVAWRESEIAAWIDALPRAQVGARRAPGRPRNEKASV